MKTNLYFESCQVAYVNVFNGIFCKASYLISINNINYIILGNFFYLNTSNYRNMFGIIQDRAISLN